MIREDAIINPKYLLLNDFVNTLPYAFDSLPTATTLHEGRNVIKRVCVEDFDLVIKCYSSLSLVNRLVYGRLRRSKSMRAYDNALRLLSLGVATPEPVAAIDTYQNGMLRGSYFISAYSDYCSMGGWNEVGEAQKIALLDDLAHFIAHIHQLGVQHNDLNVANVRCRESAQGYEFELIDNNRMCFHSRPLSERERLDDLRHFSCGTAPYVYVLDRYAQIVGIDSNLFAARGMMTKIVYETRKRLHRSVKQKVRRTL